jgi:hypothetical protein
MTDKPLRRGVFRWGNQQSGLIIDTTYHPIVFNRWYGDLTEKGSETYWEMRNDLCNPAGSKKIVLIHFFEVNAPPATVRKRGAELAQNDPFIQNGTFISLMIMKNPLLRGVLTAVLWMAGKENFPMEFMSNVEDCIRRARKILEEAGVEPPDCGDTYAIPEEKTVPWP